MDVAFHQGRKHALGDLTVIESMGEDSKMGESEVL